MPEVHREHVWISGPRGRLAGEIAYGEGASVGAALLLSPHPYMGGRMSLPLLARLAEALASRDIVALRFDYGGVGESEGPPVQIGEAMERFWRTGSAPEDPEMLEEARAARHWLVRNADDRMALVGYSFGSFLAATLHDADASALVMIAPTIARHDYSGLCNEGTPTLIVYGDGDFATTDDDLQSWARRLPGPSEIRHFPSGDHFFRGMEPEIASTCADFVARSVLHREELHR